jgi:predicted ATPase
MKRYILTGAPGAGKTAVLRLLERDGLAVVEEAATDVIALAQAMGTPEPWTDPSFIDEIVALQRQRQLRAVGDLVVFDRSPACAWALAEFLGHPPSPTLRAEVDRVIRDRIYEPRVFFLESLGFVAPTTARRIGFEESLAFEAVHAEAYRRFGYDLVRIPAAGVRARTEQILRELS